MSPEAGRPDGVGLAGKTVLVTRPGDGWDRLVERLSASGARAEFLALTTQTAPADPAPADRAARAIATYAWVVVTSANGARFLAERLAAAGTLDRAHESRVACIGPATRRAVEGVGLTVALESVEGRGEALASELARALAPGERVLVVRPESGSAFPLPPLEAAGARVDAVAFYRTVPSADAVRAAASIANGEADAVVFTAPSGVAALAAADLSGVRVVAIGPTTAAALAARGAAPHAVSASPTPDAVAEAVGRAFGVVC